MNSGFVIRQVKFNDDLESVDDLDDKNSRESRTTSQVSRKNSDVSLKNELKDE